MKKKNLFKFFNQEKELMNQCKIAQSFSSRLVGLLSSKKLDNNEALLIKKCKQVHTLFMKFPIDAIFLDKDGVIVGVEELKPWKFSKYYRKSTQVLEAKYGWFKNKNLKLGECLRLEENV